MRHYILFSLTTAAVLLLVFLVSAALWWLLAAMGDRGAAQGAKAVTLVVLCCWVLDFIALVFLLAVGYLRTTGETPERRDQRSEVRGQ